MPEAGAVFSQQAQGRRILEPASRFGLKRDSWGKARQGRTFHSGSRSFMCSWCPGEDRPGQKGPWAGACIPFKAH